ncbi:hypothetical protein YC2023_083879 [Brassica napus]
MNRLENSRLALLRLFGADRSLAVAHISLANYDWLDPLSGYVGNSSPGAAIIIKHLFLILFESSSRSFKRRSFSRHLTDESSFDRRVLTRPFCRHFDRRVLTRPTSPHSTDESSLDRSVVTSTEESSSPSGSSSA